MFAEGYHPTAGGVRCRESCARWTFFLRRMPLAPRQNVCLRSRRVLMSLHGWSLALSTWLNGVTHPTLKLVLRVGVNWVFAIGRAITRYFPDDHPFQSAA